MRWPLALLVLPAIAAAQSVAVDDSIRYQTIDGFGAGTWWKTSETPQAWWQQLCFDDLRASMVRVEITPAFRAPYSDLHYCAPWFGQPAPLTLDGSANGPDGTRTRPYTGAADYSTPFGGCAAPIAVMGPDIQTNVGLFDFGVNATEALVAQIGTGRSAELGGFKLIGTMWSPAPWLKVSTGNAYGGATAPAPAPVAFPFIWGVAFGGGKLDTSDVPRPQFNDGVADTSALTQWARGLAAFLRGYQDTFGVQFHSISIQNEPDIESYYNTTRYALAAEYIIALKRARAELDQYPDLQNIRLIGPEDWMMPGPYALWQFGAGPTQQDKNLRFLNDIAADPAAAAALAGFAIHGYDIGGLSSAGADSQSWSWVVNGWQASPGAGLPADVQGFGALGKPSWMTSAADDRSAWLASSVVGGFPDSGAFALAVKIHQALTTGQQSAWLYKSLTNERPADDVNTEALTDSLQLADAPKYVAAKHFFRLIRPGSQRVQATVTGSNTLLASAYVLDSAGSLTIVLINREAAAATVNVTLPATLARTSLGAYTSSGGRYWQSSRAPVSSGAATVQVPAYGVVTLDSRPPVPFDVRCGCGSGPGSLAFCGAAALALRRRRTLSSRRPDSGRP